MLPPTSLPLLCFHSSVDLAVSSLMGRRCKILVETDRNEHMTELGYHTLLCTMPTDASQLTAMPNKEDVMLGIPQSWMEDSERSIADLW